jgi:hypothetical protein
MGFTKVRAGDGSAAILYDHQQIIQMLIAYGLEETSETPETSDSQAEPVGRSDISGDTDVN